MDDQFMNDQKKPIGKITTEIIRDHFGKVFVSSRDYLVTDIIEFKNGTKAYVTNLLYEEHADGYEEPLVIVAPLVKSFEEFDKVSCPICGGTYNYIDRHGYAFHLDPTSAPCETLANDQE